MIISGDESVFMINPPKDVSDTDIGSILDLCDMLGNKCYKKKKTDYSSVEKNDFFIQYPTRINWEIKKRQEDD